MLDQILSLHTETLALIIALFLALVNALVGALRAENWFKLGKKALAADNLTGAINYFTKEIMDNPKNVSAYLKRAEAFEQNGESDKAQEDREAAMAINARTAQVNGRREKQAMIPTLQAQ